MEYTINSTSLMLFNATIPRELHLSTDNHTKLPHPQTLSRTRTINQMQSAMNSEDEIRLRVLKRGRSTGWTAGRLNEFKSAVKHQDSPVTWELVVVNLRHNHLFSKPGDSGSLVFDRFGDVVGLLHGNLDSETLLTPIEAVFADIKACTGATKVQLDVINRLGSAFPQQSLWRL
jgi:hypothetical protein